MVLFFLFHSYTFLYIDGLVQKNTGNSSALAIFFISRPLAMEMRGVLRVLTQRYNLSISALVTCESVFHKVSNVQLGFLQHLGGEPGVDLTRVTFWAQIP